MSWLSDQYLLIGAAVIAAFLLFSGPRRAVAAVGANLAALFDGWGQSEFNAEYKRRIASYNAEERLQRLEAAISQKKPGQALAPTDNLQAPSPPTPQNWP